ncbi:LppP/LprE family lipoprotein, partial [Mycolicibacterium fortuitum]|nr:LppP/LprE family lipoprotein [Mycolicibacterium fortuitum]
MFATAPGVVLATVLTLTGCGSGDSTVSKTPDAGPGP